MTNDLLIISAGRFGREVYNWVRDAVVAGQPWRIKGFLDSRLDALDGFNYPVPILTTVENYTPQADDLFLCPIGDPLIRQDYSEKIRRKGGRFATLVHPTAILGGNVRLGAGTMIAPYAVLTADVTVGESVYIGPHTLCSHDNWIGDGTQISGHCSLAGNVTIEELCFVGMHAVIIPRRRLGRRAFVGAGSVVTNDVEPGVKVFGNPAIPIGAIETFIPPLKATKQQS
jgi:sugar O-acyltransferase (sialic acid O-acetyltransferase NeuD family)